MQATGQRQRRAEAADEHGPLVPLSEAEAYYLISLDLALALCAAWIKDTRLDAIDLIRDVRDGPGMNCSSSSATGRRRTWSQVFQDEPGANRAVLLQFLDEGDLARLWPGWNRAQARYNREEGQGQEQEQEQEPQAQEVAERQVVEEQVEERDEMSFFARVDLLWLVQQRAHRDGVLNVEVVDRILDAYTLFVNEEAIRLARVLIAGVPQVGVELSSDVPSAKIPSIQMSGVVCDLEFTIQSKATRSKLARSEAVASSADGQEQEPAPLALLRQRGISEWSLLTASDGQHGLALLLGPARFLNHDCKPTVEVLIVNEPHRAQLDLKNSSAIVYRLHIINLATIRRHTARQPSQRLVKTIDGCLYAVAGMPLTIDYGAEYLADPKFTCACSSVDHTPKAPAVTAPNA